MRRWLAVGFACALGVAAGCGDDATDTPPKPAAGAGSGVGTAAAPAGATGGATGGTAVTTGTGASPAGGSGGSGGMTTGGAGGVPVGGTGTGGSGGGADSLVFGVIGDYGDDFLTQLGVGREDEVAALVKGWKPDFIVTVGDNNYPDGLAGTIDNNIGKYFAEYIGDYKGMFGPGSDTNRFWPALGNHDWQSGSIAAYLDYFTLPGNERYYDVDMGLVRFFFLDSEAEEPDGKTPDSIQGKWLEPLLKASTACFDIVVFHRPGYASRDGGGDVGMRWPFEEWGADAILTGHHHFYERLQVGGIPVFISGNGGSALYQFEATAPESQKQWRGHGAMRVMATRTGITFDSFGVDGAMVDTHSVAKPCP
jgi:hypothetical protein